MKNQDIKNGIYKVVCFAAKNHNQSFSTTEPPPSFDCHDSALTAIWGLQASK